MAYAKTRFYPGSGPISALSMKLSFSLAKPKQTESTPSLKRPAAFASLDDDEPVDAAATSSHNNTAPNKKLIAQNVLTSRTLKRRLEEEKKVDETVFEYDEVWDKMQAAKQRQKEAKDVDAQQRKVNHVL